MLNLNLRMAARSLTLLLACSITSRIHAQSDSIFSLPICGTLPLPTQMHGTAVVGDRLYVFGGEDTAGWSNKVISAEIGAEAKLGPWRTEAPMPELRSYLTNNVEVVNNRIYLVGGYLSRDVHTPETSMTKVHDVLWTQVGPDGRIGSWKKSAPWPGSTNALGATCSTDKYLFITGGAAGAAASSQVLVAEFAADGAPINWRTTTPLPMPLWYHAAAMLEKRLYVWTGMGPGGKTDLNARVVECDVNDDGTFGPWIESTPMPQPIYSASACGLNDYLVSVAGRYKEAYPTNVIWHSRVVNGKLEPWQMLKTDLDTRVYHALGLDKTRGYVFIVGGRNKSLPGQTGGGHYVDRVQAFQLTQPQTSELNAIVIAAGPTSGQIKPADLKTVLSAASGSGKKSLAFFYSPEVPACRRFWDTVMQTSQFRELSQQYEIAAVDITTPEGQASVQSLSIFRVPTLARFSPAGELEKTSASSQDWKDVEQLLK